MHRRSSATASGEPGSHGYDLFHVFGKFLCSYVEDGLSVFRTRKSRIWIDDHRYGGIFQQFFYDFFHLFWSKAAVDPQCVYPKSF